MSNALENYLSKIKGLTKNTGVYAYRGQAKSEWPLHSAATRKMIKAYGNGVLGNTGNIGGPGLEGGEGLEGGAGFPIVVRRMPS